MRRGDINKRGTTRRPRGPLVLLLMLFALLSGCDQQPPAQPDARDESQAAAGLDAPAQPAGPTIVSLTPAVTQMLLDMGKRDQIVGVSREDAEALGVPVCGSFNDPITERILKIAPDFVVTESGLSGVPSRLRDLADAGVFKLVVVPHCRSIAEVEQALIDAERGLGPALGDPDSAEAARKRMVAQVQAISAVVSDAPRPRVLILLNPTSLGAVGTGVTHDELLRLAGGSNAASSFNTGYVQLTRSQVQDVVRPDVILILEPGGRPIGGEDPRMRAFEGMSVPAIINRRVVVIDHPQAMLPSTSLPGVVAQIAEAVHPDRADAVRLAYELAGGGAASP